MGARRTALWGPEEVLTQEEKREIKSPDRVPRLVSLHAGPLPRWEWIKSEVTAQVPEAQRPTWNMSEICCWRQQGVVGIVA